MSIKEPIIIIGTGRCGSTIIYKLLSKHKNVLYSPRAVKLSKRPLINKLLFLIQDIPFLGYILKKKNWAVENYKLWDTFYRGFSKTHRDLEDYDVTYNAINKSKDFFENIMSRKRYKLVLKFTGWGRIGFLKTIFPDAKFIHIIRDGRATASSLMEVPFWEGWKGPKNWLHGELSSEDYKTWEESKFSYITLAGLSWSLLNSKIEKDIKKYNVEVLQIRYEDFCEDPILIMKKICDYSQIEYTKKFMKIISKAKIKNQNNKWRNNFTEEQQQELEKSVSEMLQFYGYEIKNTI